jgi:hypothetical protein
VELGTFVQNVHNSMLMPSVSCVFPADIIRVTQEFVTQPAKLFHLFINAFHFIILYFFRLDLMYVQCKNICIAIVIIKINPVHSWIVTRKCLTETNTLPLSSYPLGSTSQFYRPVTQTNIKRIKDKTLTVQSLTAFLLFINFHHCFDIVFQ